MIVKFSIRVLNLIPSDSDIDETFKSINQSIITKIKSSVSEDWVVIETIIKHSIKMFKCWYMQKILHRKMEKLGCL